MCFRNANPAGALAATALAVAALICAGASLFAAEEATPIVNAKARLDKDLVHRGEAFTLTLKVDVLKGWHVNSDKPGLPELIPTRVTLDGALRLTFDQVAYPEASAKTFSFLEKPIRVLEGSFAIRGTARFEADAKPGLHVIKGAVEYQACNDEECLPPAKAMFSVPIMLAR